MNRLFTDDSSYNDLGMAIDNAAVQVVQRIVDQFDDVDIRDLHTVLHGSVTDVITSTILHRRTGDSGWRREQVQS